MYKHILVTGGAGFIGSHIVDALIEQGYSVRVIDMLSPQVHSNTLPDYLNSRAEYIWGNLQDPTLVERALDDIDAVIHQAAAVGVGQSMYEVRHYTASNVLGTATLLEGIVHHRLSIRKLIVASSMSVYGEGAYCCPQMHKIIQNPKRSLKQLEQHVWEILCEECGQPLSPLPISEDASLRPASIYALTKRDQEELCLSIGKTYDIPTIALRYFGVYGPRQALSNPYAGLMAMFIARLLSKRAPLIFEDGKQIRDFIHVSDVAQANLKALHASINECQIYNLSRGEPVRVIDVATLLAHIVNSEIEPEITSLYRKGDIRHCYADITRLEDGLGFKPSIMLEQGLADLADWAKNKVFTDLIQNMLSQLYDKQLLI